MLRKYSIITNKSAFKCSKVQGKSWVCLAMGVEAKVSAASCSKAVDFLINLIPLVGFKAVSVQTLFVPEYGGLDLFLQTGEQSYLERLLPLCLNHKNNSREKQRFFNSA